MRPRKVEAAPSRLERADTRQDAASTILSPPPTEVCVLVQKAPALQLWTNASVVATWARYISGGSFFL